MSVLATYIYYEYLILYIRYYDGKQQNLDKLLEELYERSLEAVYKYHPEHHITLNTFITASKMITTKEEIPVPTRPKWWFW